MKKKLLSMLLASSMVMALVACGSKEVEESKEPSKSETKKEESKEEVKEEEPEEKELKEVRIIAKKDTTLYYGVEFDLANIEEHPTFAYMNELMAKYGVKLVVEPVANDQFSTVITTRIGSGDIPMDFFQAAGLSTSDVLEYGRAGVFMEINSLLEEYDEDGSVKKAWAEQWPDFEPAYTTPDGEIYFLPYIVKSPVMGDPQGLGHIGSTRGFRIRTDWLEKIGVDYKIEWTIDEIKDVLIQFREQDVNGNGVKDEIAAMDLEKWYGFAQAFGMGYTWDGEFVSFNNTTGETLVPWYMKDNMIAFVEFMQELLAEGIILEEQIGQKTWGDFTYGLAAENRVGLICDYWDNDQCEPYIPVEGAFMSPIVIDAGFGKMITVEGLGSAKGMKFVINGASDKEAMAGFLDCYYSDPEFTDLYRYGMPKDVAERYGVVNWWDRDENGKVQGAEYFGVTYTEDEYKANPYICSVGIDYFFWDTLPRTVYNPQPYEDYVTYFATQQENNAEGRKFDLNKDAARVWKYENYTKCDVNESDYSLAMATPEEEAKIAEIQTDLQTYSTETLTNLILGNYKLEDFDKYVAEMEKMGLSDYVKIYEDRRARYNAIMGK